MTGDKKVLRQYMVPIINNNRRMNLMHLGKGIKKVMNVNTDIELVMQP